MQIIYNCVSLISETLQNWDLLEEKLVESHILLGYGNAVLFWHGQL